MRTSAIYSNICWYRFGRYQYQKCDKCSKKPECDFWYDPITNEIQYPKLYFSQPEKAPTKVTFKPIPGGIYEREIEPYI